MEKLICIYILHGKVLVPEKEYLFMKDKLVDPDFVSYFLGIKKIKEFDMKDKVHQTEK